MLMVEQDGMMSPALAASFRSELAVATNDVLLLFLQSTKVRRLGGDDVEAALRLPSLNESHHHDLLCEFTGLFAIAHRIDRVHKNDWIGFQPWRAAVAKASQAQP